MTTAHAPLHIDALRRARASARIGHTIHYFDATDSTNTVAQRLAVDGAAEGTTVVAEVQSKGRGRLGRTWLSPPFRNLHLSIVLRPPVLAASAPSIGLVAGVATAETVREWVADVALKWPNDVLIGGRKVAGILTELEAQDHHVSFVILGIGVNLNMNETEIPDELRDKAVSICTLTGSPVDRTVFAERLLSQLEERYHLFLHAGFAAIRPLCETLSPLTGRLVRIDSGGRQQEGTVIGVADDGSLCLRDAAGHGVRVVAGEVSIVGGYEKRSGQRPV